MSTYVTHFGRESKKPAPFGSQPQPLMTQSTLTAGTAPSTQVQRATQGHVINVERESWSTPEDNAADGAEHPQVPGEGEPSPEGLGLSLYPPMVDEPASPSGPQRPDTSPERRRSREDGARDGSPRPFEDHADEDAVRNPAGYHPTQTGYQGDVEDDARLEGGPYATPSSRVAEPGVIVQSPVYMSSWPSNHEFRSIVQRVIRDSRRKRKRTPSSSSSSDDEDDEDEIDTEEERLFRHSETQVETLVKQESVSPPRFEPDSPSPIAAVRRPDSVVLVKGTPEEEWIEDMESESSHHPRYTRAEKGKDAIRQPVSNNPACGSTSSLRGQGNPPIGNRWEGAMDKGRKDVGAKIGRTLERLGGTMTTSRANAGTMMPPPPVNRLTSAHEIEWELSPAPSIVNGHILPNAPIRNRTFTVRTVTDESSDGQPVMAAQPVREPA
jgi:hypothetical protein